MDRCWKDPAFASIKHERGQTLAMDGKGHCKGNEIQGRQLSQGPRQKEEERRK
jgi:hypothetical protein